MINVVVAIIRNTVGDILIAQRPPGSYAGGLWEFPGGKIEVDEEIFQALQREILEELNIQVTSAYPWLTIEHDYSDRQVLLNVWVVDHFAGEPHGAEGQLIRWITPAELDNFSFPAGNQLIIEKLKTSS